MKRYIVFNDMGNLSKYIAMFIRKLLKYDVIYREDFNISVNNQDLFLPLLYDLNKYRNDASIYILFKDKYKDKIYYEILKKMSSKRIIYIDKINIKNTIKTVNKIKKDINKRKIIMLYLFIKLKYLLSKIKINKKSNNKVLLFGDLYREISYLNDETIKEILKKDNKELVRIKYKKRFKNPFTLYNDNIIESILKEIPKYKEVIYIRHKNKSNFLIYDYLIDKLVKEKNIKIKKIVFDNTITKEYIINCLLN